MAIDLPIAAQNLLLREATLDDKAFFVDLAFDASAPDFDFYDFLPGEERTRKRVEAKATRFLERNESIKKAHPRNESRKYYNLIIAKKERPDKAIGFISLDAPNNGFDGWNLGYYLIPQERKKGYATEAAQYLMTHFFSSRPKEYISAVVLPQNKASQTVLEKLNFKKTTHPVFLQRGDGEENVYLRFILDKDNLKALPSPSRPLPIGLPRLGHSACDI